MTREITTEWASEITTEWTLDEMGTLRMAIADRIRDMRDDNIHYDSLEFQAMRTIHHKIVLMHEDMAECSGHNVITEMVLSSR